jgi:hypothetical protein
VMTLHNPDVFGCANVRISAKADWLMIPPRNYPQHTFSPTPHISLETVTRTQGKEHPFSQALTLLVNLGTLHISNHALHLVRPLLRARGYPR